MRRLQATTWLAALALLMLSTPPARGAEPLRLTLRDGRAWTGFVDARSNDEQLWLRVERPGLTLWRPVAWASIASLTQRDQPVEISAVRMALARWTSPSPPRVARPVGAAPRPVTVSPQVTHVAIDAQTANWDADVEQDGIVVDVQPLSADAELVPLAGSVEIELIGAGPPTTTRLVTFPRLGRWVEPLAQTGIASRGYRFRLPYDRAGPEFDRTLGNAAVVHVRLVAPGHGTFETSTSLSQLRPFAPLRDALEQQTLRRFFPTERTGQGVWQHGIITPP